MNNHIVLNGRGCRSVQSSNSPFKTCNTKDVTTIRAVNQQVSHETIFSFASLLTLGDLSRAVQCGKTAFFSGLVSSFLKTELLFKVLSNQNFSQASSKTLLGVGRKLRVHSTPIVAAFENGFSCVITTSANR